jgi:hypothetical protein
MIFVTKADGGPFQPHRFRSFPVLAHGQQRMPKIFTVRGERLFFDFGVDIVHYRLYRLQLFCFFVGNFYFKFFFERHD